MMRSTSQPQAQAFPFLRKFASSSGDSLILLRKLCANVTVAGADSPIFVKIDCVVAKRQPSRAPLMMRSTSQSQARAFPFLRKFASSSEDSRIFAAEAVRKRDNCRDRFSHFCEKSIVLSQDDSCRGTAGNGRHRSHRHPNNFPFLRKQFLPYTRTIAVLHNRT